MNELDDLLHRAAAAAPLPGLDVDAVRRRARRTQRRRVVASVVGVAATLAVVGGIGWAALSGDSDERGVQPAGPSPTAPTKAVDNGVPDKPAVVTIDVDRVELQEKQTIAPVWAGGEIQMMGPTDGTIRVKHAKLTDLSRFGDPSDSWVIGLDDARAELVVVDLETGKDLFAQHADSLAVSADHRFAAWFYEWKGFSMISTELQPHPLPFLNASVTSVAGINPHPDGVCAAACEVLVGVLDDAQQPKALLVRPDTKQMTELPLRNPTAFGDTDIVGLDSLDGDTACYSVLSASSSYEHPRLSECDWGLHAFNPDGTRILGLPPYLDGLGFGKVAFLDADTLAPIREFDTAQGDYFVDAQWDTDGTILALVWHDSAYVLLKLHQDGSIGHVMNAPGEEGDPPISLPGTP